MAMFRRPAAALAVALVSAGLLGAVATPAAASGAVPPVVANGAAVVRATALPTAQINGIAYAQVIVGDTVYVGGNFSTARPAGVAKGGAGEVTRGNLMAYSLSTGQIVQSFAPSVNNTVRALAVSPDGTRLYVGGLFTAINGVPRYRLASFDVSSGTLVASFKPIPSYIVQSLVATNAAVYFGGKFNNVSGVTRSNLAAVQKDTGKVLDWAPVADATVQAMVSTPDRTKIVVGGNFGTLNGVTARGLGSVAVSNGATQSFAVNQLVYGYGTKAAFLSLASDGKAIYGTAFNFGGSGNFEGTFSADPNTGALNWIEDCHGDTYSVYAAAGTVYTVGHAHYCGNIGGFPQVANAGDAHRALAFTTTVGGTVQRNQQANYADFDGQPAPSLRNWLPDLKPGSVSGADQAAWTVTGKGGYVVMGGEFPTVNGVAQQGLVRFATAPTSPNTSGPQLSGALWKPTITSTGATTSRATLPTNWDRDDIVLKYTITRDTGSGTPSTNIYTARVSSLQWSRPTITVDNTGLKSGVTYRYRSFASDAAGNSVASDFVTYTPTGS